MDSEWHGLLECPLGYNARKRFIMHCNVPRDYTRFISKHRTIEGLVRLVVSARADVVWLDGLARMAAEVQFERRRFFRTLASRDAAAVPTP